MLTLESIRFPYFLTGYGLGGYFGGYDQIGRYPVSSSPNFFLNILHQFGFIGFFIIISLFSLIIVNIYKSYKFEDNQNYKTIKLATISGLISLFITANLFPAFLHFPISSILGIFIALSTRKNQGSELQSISKV